MLWASRQLGAPIPERVTGSDGVPMIARHAAQKGWKLFLLGAAEGIAERAAAILREQQPQLIISGSYGGSPAPSEEDEIVAKINASGADILLVAYGAPNQDKWIARNLPRLNVAMAMGIGGSLDFIAGGVPRAPRGMRGRPGMALPPAAPALAVETDAPPARFALAVLRQKHRQSAKYRLLFVSRFLRVNLPDDERIRTSDPECQRC